MPYIHIPSRRIRIELLSLLVCFVIAMGLNVYAILHYDAPLKELWTSILYVLMATAVFYGVWVVVRLIVYGVARLFGYKPKKHHHHRHHHSSHRYN